jgi:hypothetical protein
VIESKQNYIFGAKDSKYRKGPYFPTAPPCFYFSLTFILKPLMKKPTFKSLIYFAHSGLKSNFLIWGFKINFQEKNKNMEWQMENMATSGILKSFDPIK